MPKIQKMKIVLVCLGTTNNYYLQEGIANYIKRLKHRTDGSRCIV